MDARDYKIEDGTRSTEAVDPEATAVPGVPGATAVSGAAAVPSTAAVPKRPAPTINSLQSFNEVTVDRQVAGLYFYLQLDCLIDLAYRVACDFFGRPRLYTDLGAPTIAPDLAKLRARYGSNERIPSQEQRDAIYLPIFGQSGMYWTDGQSQFADGRDGLLNAATAFSERVYDTGEDMLRARVRTFHRTFKLWLARFNGDSLQWSKGEALAGVTEDLAYKILRNRGVAAVFGINTPPSQAWPYKEDSFGDMLIEEISKQLVVASNSHKAITAEVISYRQRAALRGAEALATIIDLNEGGPNSELDLLITRCYTWAAALMSLPNLTAAPQGSEPADQPMYRG
jgi:hypothetical protein